MVTKLCRFWLGTVSRRLAVTAGIMLLAVLPVMAAEPLTVVLNQAELLRLDRDASIVIVANPIIGDVAIESPRLVFFVGRQVGETSLHILDRDDREILRVPVVVVPHNDRYVTVHRQHVETTLNCAPRCVMVHTPGAELSTSPSTTRQTPAAMEVFAISEGEDEGAGEVAPSAIGETGAGGAASSTGGEAGNGG